MAASGEESVSLSFLIKRTVQDAFAGLEDLVDKNPQRSDTERKIHTLKYINRTRQRLLRLHAVSKWCNQTPLLKYCQQLDGVLSMHEQCFTQAADSLFFTHEGLQQARAPIYDVASAIEVLLTGNYARLPKCIEEIGMQTPLEGEELEEALRKLNTLLRLRLLDTMIPREVSKVTVSDGKVILNVEGEFNVHLTLGYRGHLNYWRVLHLELLVGEKKGLLKLSEIQRFALGDDLERRMAAAEKPFQVLYSMLHEFCISLVMDTVIRQLRSLLKGRWKDAIRIELTADPGQAGTSTAQTQTPSTETEADTVGIKVPGVKISYWLDPIKMVGNADSRVAPFLKIEPSHDQHIICSHSTFVIDPMTGSIAEFVLNQGCIDVEYLLLRAISCNIHTRLLEVERTLRSNNQLCQVDDDIFLKHPGDVSYADSNKISEFSQNINASGDCAEEVLCVRAYGPCYVALGINIRNGRFTLCYSRKLVLPSAISEYENALNAGVQTTADVFVSLRNKSILHLFASNAKFLDMKVYDKGVATSRIPRKIIQGSDLLLMGFPNCGNSYFLLVQLDKNFKPIFHLLQGSSRQAGSVEFLSYVKIDVGALQLVEDEVNLSLLENELSTFCTEEADGVDMGSAAGICMFSGEARFQNQGSFPPLVDHVFDVDMMPSELSPSRYTYNPQGSQQAGLFATSTPRREGMPQFTTIRGDSGGEHVLPVSGECTSVQGNISNSMYSVSRPKRSLSDLVKSLPSLQNIVAQGHSRKKQRLMSGLGNAESTNTVSSSERSSGKIFGRTYGSILMDANVGKVPSRVYVAVLLQVVRYCSLSIKHNRLISQMEDLKITYTEDVHSCREAPYIIFKLHSLNGGSWKHLFLSLGKPGNTHWDVKVNDSHFRDLWELQKGRCTPPWGSGVRIANTSDVDSHIRLCPDGVVLSYKTVEDNSIQMMVADIKRLYNARTFALGMRKLLEVKDDRLETGKEKVKTKMPLMPRVGSGEGGDKYWELARRTFKIEAVGLMSLWFSYFGSMPGVIARFVVEWEPGKDGCTMHVSPDQLWPHTKFLEDFINGGQVYSLLDCIRLTAGPLHALAGAIRPARMVGTSTTGMALVPPGSSTARTPNGAMNSQGLAQSTGSPTVLQSPGGLPSASPNVGGTTNSTNLNGQNGSIVSNSSRGGPGIVPSSLLPTDVSVVLRSPYWIRIIYRKNFAVDMRCFAGDQVWLQPATPPKGGPSAGGSMPCPQFRPFIMEHVALGLNTLEPSLAPHSGSPCPSNNLNAIVPQNSPAGGNRMSATSPGVSPAVSRPTNPNIVLNRLPNVNSMLGGQNVAAFNSGMPSLPGRPMVPGGGMPMHVRGDLNTAFIGLGDDGGYGGGWVPLIALKKVLRGILKYLGVLWLFSQLPDLLRVTLRSILKENEGSLLNLDNEQPALRFFVGGYVFAVSVHRIQLLLQVLSVKRFHQQQQQQQQQQQPQNQLTTQDELSPHEIAEICDYFSRRVASEPYDASRVASFITLLTLPISVLREFLKLITWKRGTAQGQNSDIAPSQRPRVELCLENHRGTCSDSQTSTDGGEISSTTNVAKSNIHYDRVHNAVEFGLTVVLDPASIPNVYAAGGAAWLPHCVSVRLKYSFGENPQMSLLKMEGSHGGRACWPGTDDWERCKQKVAKAVAIAGSATSSVTGSPVDINQGRLRVVAETLQHSLQTSLHQLRRSPNNNHSSMPGSTFQP